MFTKDEFVGFANRQTTFHIREDVGAIRRLAHSTWKTHNKHAIKSAMRVILLSLSQ